MVRKYILECKQYCILHGYDKNLGQPFAELDDWELAAAEQLASSCKSVCAALMVVKGRLKLEEVLKIARIEEDDQIEKWGLVEGGHDIDIADANVRISAPFMFLKLILLR